MEKSKKHSTIIFIIIAFIIISALIESQIRGKDKEEKAVIHFPAITDFPNGEEGTVVFNLGFPKGAFRIGDKVAEILMFLDSQTIPNLRIVYNTQEKKIYAGLPPLISSEIDILDGQKHELAYMFNRKESKQAIIFDGKPVAHGEYTGKTEKDLLSGYAVMENIKIIQSPIQIEARFS